MEAFDVLLTDISRTNIEIIITNTMKVLCEKWTKNKKIDKNNVSLNIENQRERKLKMTREYCLK